MSNINISYCNETLDVKSNLFKEMITTHMFIKVDDIYKLSRLAYKYSLYNLMYYDFQTCIAQRIIDNDEKYISKLPKNLVNLVKELVELFRIMEIPEEFKDKSFNFIFKKQLDFTLVSKKLLKDSVWKVLIPFTNIHHIVRYGEKNIAELFSDIQKIVYGNKFSTSIVFQVSSYDIEVSPISERAYSIENLPLPIPR